MTAGPIELLSRARAGETEALGELCALYRNYWLKKLRRSLDGPPGGALRYDEGPAN
jgi:RNA polymerase sigma-70 factor (ECF subfamily)